MIDGVGLARFVRERAVEGERGEAAGPPTSVRNLWLALREAGVTDRSVGGSA
ncbi:hypothetical protein ACIHEJ_40430 [Streptomyces sp. NPDC052301]|uniref:hypothetical protein n=1 Tax=Streptomyces sp. NPDC052301 TaxID=3365687 RepID=UPI0037D773FA